MSTLVSLAQWIFALYFACAYGARVALNLLAIPALRRSAGLRAEDVPPAYAGLLPPVSVLVPACDAEARIVDSIGALLRLEWPQLEVVVVNDGSKDATLDALKQAFELEPFPEAPWHGIRTRGVRTFYRSRTQPRLRVLDKEPGGRADALNAAINAARFPLLCPVDVGAVLARESLSRVVEPFLDDRATLVASGTARVANGCRISDGRLEHAALPREPLVLLQVVESFSASVFGRAGRTPIGAALPPPGALTVLRRDALVDAGGYRVDVLDEDVELAARLQRTQHAEGARHAIRVVPDAVSWVTAPESLDGLKSERQHRQRALAASLRRSLARRDGAAAPNAISSWLALIECYGPVVETAAYIFMIAMWLLGVIPGAAIAAFLALAFSSGVLLSASGLWLEALYSGIYPRFAQVAILAAAAIAENLGYRQLVTLWRAGAVLRG